MTLVNVFYTVVDFLTRDSSEMMGYINSVVVQGKYSLGAAASWFYTVIVLLSLMLVFLIVKKIINTKNESY